MLLGAGVMHLSPHANHMQLSAYRKVPLLIIDFNYIDNLIQYSLI